MLIYLSDIWVSSSTCHVSGLSFTLLLCCAVQVAGMMGPAACLFAAASPLVHSPYVATGLITLGMGLSALTCSKCIDHTNLT
jgi:hypothetical protein